MNRADILYEAKICVTRDRNATHGNPEDSFAAIAELWSAHLHQRITGIDVAVMMALLKCARIKANPANPDNWIDGAGYLACGGEIATGASA